MQKANHADVAQQVVPELSDHSLSIRWLPSSSERRSVLINSSIIASFNCRKFEYLMGRLAIKTRFQPGFIRFIIDCKQALMRRLARLRITAFPIERLTDTAI